MPNAISPPPSASPECSPERLPSGGICTANKVCGRSCHRPDSTKFTCIRLVDLVFTGMVCPVGIMAEHGGGNAEAEEYIVVAALCVGNGLRQPIVARTGLSVEVCFAGLDHYVC